MHEITGRSSISTKYTFSSIIWIPPQTGDLGFVFTSNRHNSFAHNMNPARTVFYTCQGHFADRKLLYDLKCNFDHMKVGKRCTWCPLSTMRKTIKRSTFQSLSRSLFSISLTQCILYIQIIAVFVLSLFYFVHHWFLQTRCKQPFSEK